MTKYWVRWPSITVDVGKVSDECIFFGAALVMVSRSAYSPVPRASPI